MKNDIPKQLMNEEFRFIPIKKGTKEPIEKLWPTTNNYRYYDTEHFRNDSYGVVCGFGELYVLDFDDKETQDKILPQLPKTFSVKSGGKGLLHLYFIAPEGSPKSFKIFRKGTKETLLDLQGCGKQVIGPGSIHCDTGNTYEVYEDLPITELDLSYVINLLLEYDLLESNKNAGSSSYTKLVECKFHEDAHPSLAIYQDSGTFYCFGCGAYGFIDTLSFNGKLKTKKTKNGTHYYIDKNDIIRYFNLFKDESINDKEIENKKEWEKYDLFRLKRTIRTWLGSIDDEWLDIILACALDRKVPEEPIWIFIVGVPSSTKTEIVRCFQDGPMFYQLSTLTPNSLISGYVKPNGDKIEDLATQLDGKILILKDFTTILTMNKEKRDEIVGQLREAYDGEISKKLGNLDKKIHIKSNFGFMACVTPIIDQHYRIMSQLGERCLKVRGDPNEDEMLEKVVANSGKEKEMRTELIEAVMGFITHVEIKAVTLSPEDMIYLKQCAKILARLRAPDQTRYERNEYIEDNQPLPEKPTRLFKQLVKLVRALGSIYSLESCNSLILERIKRITLDSAPKDRGRVYSYLITHKSVTEATLEGDLKIHRTSLQRILSFFERIGLADKQYVLGNNVWSIKKEYDLSLNTGADAPKDSQTYEQNRNNKTFFPLSEGVSGRCYSCKELEPLWWKDQEENKYCPKCKTEDRIWPVESIEG